MRHRGRGPGTGGRPPTALALGVLLLCGCAAEGGPAALDRSSVPPVPSAAPSGSPGGAARIRTYTPEDDGAVVELRRGDTVELVLPDPAAPAPRVEGGAVELVEVSSFAPTGSREFELRATEPGQAVVRGDGPPPWGITVRVVA